MMMERGRSFSELDPAFTTRTRTAQRPVKLGFRFSTKALMPPG